MVLRDAKGAIAPLLIFLLSGCMGNGAGEADVLMQGVRFVPDHITVAVGDEVLWKNSSSLGHTVTSNDPDGPLDSGDLSPGSEFRFTFGEPGTYAYHCVPHATERGNGTYEGMVGLVVVLPG